MPTIEGAPKWPMGVSGCGPVVEKTVIDSLIPAPLCWVT
jgi:hypothetical protein